MLFSLLGGLLIGAASVLLMASLGRIAGISTITAKLFAGEPWRIVFVIGLILGAFLVGTSAIVAPTVSLTQLLIAGVFVGVGTSLGNGCTSGHGVCGNALLSPRSLVATLIFMATGILTVWIF